MEWQDEYRKKCVSMEEAAKQVKLLFLFFRELLKQIMRKRFSAFYRVFCSRHSSLRQSNIHIPFILLISFSGDITCMLHIFELFT